MKSFRIPAISFFIAFFIFFTGPLVGEGGSSEARELWTNLYLGSKCLIGDDIKGWGAIELIGYKGLMTVLISGKSGKFKDRVDTYSRWVRIGDIDNDNNKEIIMTAQRMMGTTMAIVYLEPSWGDWETILSYEGQSAQIYSLHDFNGDGKKEILGKVNNQMALYDIEEQGALWEISKGEQPHTALVDMDGNGTFEIATLRWKKNPNGRFKFANQFTSYRYDIMLHFVDPATGDIIGELDRALDVPSSNIIAADLSGNGADDVIMCIGPDLYVVRDQAIYSDFIYEVEIPIEEAKVKLGDNMPVSFDGFNVRASLNFLGLAVGDFHPDAGLEIVTTTALGDLIALNADGDILWETRAGLATNPVIADLNGDGDQEIIVPLVEGRVVAFDGASGEELYSITSVVNPDRLFVGDVNGDGKLDLVMAYNKGISAWTFDATGKIEWAVECGDATGTGNYGLSREYVNRIANTRHIILFPYFKEGIMGLLIVLAGVGIALYFRRGESALKVMKSAEVAGPLARMEKAYSEKPDSPETVLPLAREYAKSDAVGITAAEVYRKALKMAPDDKALIDAGARAFVARQVLNRNTERVIQLAYSSNPNDKKFVEGMVRLYAKNNRSDPFAMNLYHKYFTGENYKQPLLKEAAKALSKNECKDAFSAWIYQLGITNDPAAIDYLMPLLGCLKEQNKPDDYLAWAYKYLSDPRMTPEMRREIVDAFREWGRNEDAEKFVTGI